MSPNSPRNPFATRELPETTTERQPDDVPLSQPEAWQQVPFADMPTAERFRDLTNCWCVMFGCVEEESGSYCPICHRKRSMPTEVALHHYLAYCATLSDSDSARVSHPTAPAPVMDPMPEDLPLREAVARMRIYAYNDSFPPWRVIVRREDKALYQITMTTLTDLSYTSEALMRSHLLLPDLERHFRQDFDARLNPARWHAW